MLNSPAQPLPLFGPFQIEQLLGEGAMSQVYRAYHLFAASPCVLKVLRRKFRHMPAVTEQFLREGRLLSQLSHPNIIACYTYGTLRTIPYIVLEYLPGHTLRQLLRIHQRLTPRYAVEIAAQAASGLADAYIHEAVIHADIKPENLWVTPLDQNPWQVKVLDFGLSLRQTQLETDQPVLSLHTRGTPQYMAPEILSGDLDVNGQADVYSLGAVLFEMLTGSIPYPAHSPAGVAALHEKGSPLSLDDFLIKPHLLLDRILQRSLAVDPNQRWSGMAEFAAALRAIQDHQ